MSSSETSNSLEGIAIISMSGRFPGANNIEEFWENLRSGVESISTFTDEELIASGIAPELLSDPNYVKSLAVLENIDLFDASFFGFNPREAEITDPQHRLFLEYAWEALENAGYDSQRCESRIGVYAGSSSNNYLSLDLNSDQVGLASIFQKGIGNDRDFLATRVSYKLNLTGPSLTVQTACSTSLVAISLACQSLLNYQCDMALAGGVSIHILQKTGYLYEEGGILSPDGHCRAFDAKAKGTIIGNGLGIVVLKRLSEAIADGDNIYAVIKGSAINNDGSGKIGYTAPSVNGQADVIAEALALAGLEPETISYVEAHGTGTVLGDPIEISALTSVFSESTDKKGFCAIGSVKTNIGHLDAAAGIAGLIKTVLALKHKQIPPSLNFEQPNPQIDFANSPFYVNTTLTEWKAGLTPRRAGVSSLGIGGTNAHVILEEAPALGASSPSRPWQLLVLSAKTDSALETATENLVQYLKQHSDITLADVAHTLQVGRWEFNHRRVLVCEDIEDATSALQVQDPERVFTNLLEAENRPIAFMFPGQGAQYVDMGKELYQTEPIFREQVDLCCQLLQPHIGLDLRSLIYPGESESEAAAQKLQQTDITQPALFVIEYALAQLWMSWGISPGAMIGHSIGEYVAACLAGVMSLEDALALVAARGRLMQQLPSGAMLSVPLPEEEIKALLDEKLSLAACNAPALCVVSGNHDAIEVFQNKLQGIECRRLHTSHAFHSQMMKPILEPFQKEISKVKLHPPKIPFISNVTGTWITAEQATDPNYWAKHLRQTVQFAAGISTLSQEPNYILLEVGPGRTLSSFTKKHLDSPGLSSLRHPQEKQSDVTFLLNTLGNLWLYGVQVDWSRFYTHEHRHRLTLPTYPFERQRYWIEPEKLSPLTKKHPQQRLTTQEIWKSLVEVGQFQASEGISGFDNHTYLANKQCLEHLCTVYMNLALRRLGAFSNPSQNYSLEELFEQCQVIPRYRQLLCRWLDVLVERGHVKQDGELFTNLLPLSADSINSLVKEFRLRWADIPQQIELVQNFGENLADILIGEKEPLELYAATLAKEGEISRQNLPADIYYNAIIHANLEVVIKSLPSEVNLRILEIGGGTGITTAELLPILPSKQTNYTFTDIGSFFLTEAEKKFSAYPFVEYRLLNIEQPPSEQGYKSHSFDVVVAVNVLHVTQNIGKTLEYVRSLLAPEGLLLIQEITQPQLDFDMIDGLLMNPLEDEQRSRGNPFLSKEQWQEALRNHGFVEVAAFSEIDAFGQYVLVAQASASTALPAASAFTVTFEQIDAENKPQVSLHEKPDISDWFYIPSWKRLMPPQLFSSKLQATQPGCWLVFIDECGLGDKIVQRLTLESQNAIIVRIGEQFSSEIASDQRVYTINPRRRDDYYALLKELNALELTPKMIVHLWSLTLNSGTELTIESLEKCETLSFYSLVFLAQALAEQQNMTSPVEIGIVSNNLQEVTGSEVLDPGKAFVLGPCKVIQQEYPNIICRSIDILIPETENWQQEKLIDQLLAEFTVQSSDRVVAYRGNYRWVQTFEPVSLDGMVEAKPQFRERGVYLITGGLGGVGLFNAEYLAKTVQAKLILIGRSAFPEPDEWSQWLSDYGEQDSVSRKILKLQELEALGAEVLVVKADVTNREQMEAAITHGKNRFGQINGVIHNAVESQQEFFAQKTLETGRIFLAPKVIGTIILDHLFKDTELDFFVLTSSQASVVGGIGLVEYTAECAFIDAFAYYSVSKNSRFIRSINWNRWKTPEWMTKTSLDRVSELTLEEAALTLEEGMEAFRRILFCSTIPQVIVSRSDLNNLINRNLINLKDTLNALEEEFTKVRRDKPTHPRPNLVNAYIAPRTEIEHILTDIWQEIFSIEQVGIHDNFFELGGDSLVATIVISRLRKTFNIELSHKRFFEEPNIAELALLIEEMILEVSKDEILKRQLKLSPLQGELFEKRLRGEVDSYSQLEVIPRRSQTSPAPLSFAQQRLWFLHQIDPGNTSYNEQGIIQLVGTLDVVALEQSFNEIVRRHEALRTTFEMVEDQPVQVIHSIPTANVTITVENVCKLPEGQRNTDIQRLIVEESQRTFDLIQGPLLRCTLLRVGEQKHILLFTIHHIVSDGWSIGLLVRELAALYEAFSTGKPSPLPELPIQYADFAVWQRQWMQGEVLHAQLAYWKKQLGNNLPVTQLPTTRPRAEVKTNRGATSSFVIPSNLSKALQALSHEEGVTLFMTLLAGFQVLLQRYTNQDDIVVGTDVANRNRAEIEALIGFFVNLLVLRTDLSGNPTFRELLKRVRQVALGAYAHQDLPFDQLVKALQPERNLSNSSPLFQVLFVLQNTPLPALELPGLTLSFLEAENKIARFDLALFLTKTEQGILGRWQYNADIFDAIAITSLTDNFQKLLNSIISRPDTRIGNLEMLTETQKKQQAMRKQERKAFNREKFLSVVSKPVIQSQERLIKTDYLQVGQTFPLVIQPAEEIDLVFWAKANREFLERKLLKHGAILLRGFNVNSGSEFESVAQAICPDLFGDYGDLPRAGEGGKVYGSTPYPADTTILFHNESSHLDRFPLKIWFFCIQPAQQGGETPIVDCRKAYKIINPKLRERLAEKQLMYVRNYTDGLDVSWQDFFQTNDKLIVENYCKQAKIDFEWYDQKGLVTRQIRPAIAVHPQTGDKVFFNQIQLHHIAYLDTEVRESLLSLFGEQKLPRNVYYGDGTPIEDSVIAEINEVYQQSKISFPWHQGDILMLDNILTAHGRYAYIGQRKVVVAMGEMAQSKDIAY